MKCWRSGFNLLTKRGLSLSDSHEIPPLCRCLGVREKESGLGLSPTSHRNLTQTRRSHTGSGALLLEMDFVRYTPRRSLAEEGSGCTECNVLCQRRAPERRESSLMDQEWGWVTPANVPGVDLNCPGQGDCWCRTRRERWALGCVQQELAHIPLHILLQ